VSPVGSAAWRDPTSRLRRRGNRYRWSNAYDISISSRSNGLSTPRHGQPPWQVAHADRVSENARSGPGCVTTLHAAPTSAHRADADPRLEIRPERAGASPDWRTFGSRPRYATSLRLVMNRDGSPIAPRKLAAQIRFTPDTVINRRISGQPSASRAISRSTAETSASRNAICRRPASIDSRSSNGSSRSASHRRPLTPNRSANPGLACSRRWSTAWISFLARVCPPMSCSRRASRRPKIRQGSSGIQTASSSPSTKARQGARVEFVGLRAGARDTGVIRTDHHHPLHVRLQKPRDLPTAPRHLQSHPVGGQQALRKQPQALRGARDPTRGAHHSLIADRDQTETRCTSRPIARPTHLINATTSPPQHGGQH